MDIVKEPNWSVCIIMWSACVGMGLDSQESGGHSNRSQTPSLTGVCAQSEDYCGVTASASGGVYQATRG